MILRRGTAPTESPTDGDAVTVAAELLSGPGGLQRLSVEVHTLPAGGWSSDPHWHEQRDELLYVLDGQLAVVEDATTHTLRPGDTAAWAAGVPVAHQVHNPTTEPARYLMAASRTAHDVVHYPTLGRTLTIDGPRWRLVDDDGRVLREGREA